MVKKICISISDKTYKDFLQSFKGNKSNFIEEKFLYGIESDIYEVDSYKSIILDLRNQIRNLNEEIRGLKLVNGRLFKNKPYDKDLEERKRRVRAINFSGVLGDE